MKPGKGYRRHKTLDKILNVENYCLEGGVVFGGENVERAGKVLYLPVYFVSLFKNE